MRIGLLSFLLTIFFSEVYSQTCSAPTASDVTICSGSTATLSASGQSGSSFAWYDAASGGNLLGTNPVYTTPVLTANTTYYVQLTIGGCTSFRTPVNVSIRSNPVASEATICAGGSATLTASGSGGTYEWFDAPSGGNLLHRGASYTTPPLNVLTTYYVQSTANGCTSGRTATTVSVNPYPGAPTASDATICSGSVATLTATAPGGVYQWFTNATGGSPLIVSPDFTTPVLTASTVYYLQTILNGCVSGRTAVTVTVNPIPPVPTVSGITICSGSSGTLTATGSGGGYEWFDVPSRGNVIATSASYTTPVLTRSTTYYVQTTVNGCSSARTPVIVTVNQPPAPPTVQGITICQGSTGTLTASGSGGTYMWYDSPTGGSLLATNPSYTTPSLNANTTYYVEATNGCTSTRVPVTVAVTTIPSAPTASGTTICSGYSATLFATGPGGVYDWYDAATGGNLLLTNSQYTTPVLSGTTTYYVQTTINGCASARTSVTVQVDPTPNAPTVSGTTICPGSAATLTSTAPGGTYQWYDSASGGGLLGTGAAFTTPALTSSTTYYVQTTVGGCTSTRTPVTVSVHFVADPEFSYISGTFCKTSPNPTPFIYTPSGGTFSASPAGLVFISTTTGQINLSASTSGTYTITFVNNGPCPAISNASVTISDTPGALFTYNAPLCQGGPDASPTYSSGASGGTFSASPAGLVLTGNGTILLSQSLPGTYTVTNTIPPNGGCGTTASTTVTIYPSPTVNAGPDQVISPGIPASLSGTVSGAGSFIWSGGLGTFSNPNILNPTYTPAPGETSVILYLTATGAGPCISQNDLTITITLIAPTAAVTTICAGSTAALTATGPGGPYEWYDAPSGGNLLITNATYISPPLTANTTYYVQTTMSGSASARTAVTVTVNAIPSAPVSGSVTICAGNSASLSATSPGGSYQWYDAPSAGNLLATSATYTTPILTTNTTYYVQTTINGCTSARTLVSVTVNLVPLVTSAAKQTICNATSPNYTITADLPGTSFIWSRAALPNISNPAATNQTSSVIGEILMNTATVPVAVTYIITPILNGCAGPSLNYVVTVDPSPLVTSSLTGAICNDSASNYTVAFNMPGTNFSWSRLGIAGISNAAIAGQASGTIREVLTNTTNAPVDVTYTFNYSFDGCPGPAFNYVVRVNPIPVITSSPTNIICNGATLNYAITSNVSGTTFVWTRPASTNISNAAVSGQTSSTITETLINTGTTAVDVIYTIIPTANGCTGAAFNYVVTVNPTPITPLIISNSPVCVNTTISLDTQPVSGATYSWTGPNGFTSAQQNPRLSNVSQLNAGAYSLITTVNGCTSFAGSTTVLVNALPLANAGNNQTVCINTNSIVLSGSITGGASTGIWTSNGTGTFSPSNTALNTTYIPSAADKNAGSVVLTLTSTGNDNCTPSISPLSVTFDALPTVQAGPDQEVCSQNPIVSLNGQVTVAPGGIWTTSGTGAFIPSNTALNAVYISSSLDIANGAVVLTLIATGSTCNQVADALTVRILPPPTVDIGPDLYVPLNRTIILKPKINDPNAQYLWTPNINLSDNTVKNPVLTGVSDQTYTLRVTDSRGCVTIDDVFVDVLMPIAYPNTFTPNGDGINDVWNILELITYPGNTVNIYNRYGVKMFTSTGYSQPWDGTYKGKPAPIGTYYYIINTQFPDLIYAGSITVLR